MVTERLVEQPFYNATEHKSSSSLLHTLTRHHVLESVIQIPQEQLITVYENSNPTE
jgi:hypothetical protein